MSDYDLSLTGAQIDAALTKVHNADTSPVNGSVNMVTSDAVYDAVNDIQFANLNNNLVSTDLSTGNNNTTIPTTQAVTNLVSSGSIGPKIAYFTAPDGQTYTSGGSNYQDLTTPLVETADPYNIATVSSGEITLGAGIYHITFFGEYKEDDNNTSDYVDVEYQIDGTTVDSKRINETGVNYLTFQSEVVHESNSNFVVRIRENFRNQTNLYYQGVRVIVVKYP